MQGIRNAKVRKILYFTGFLKEDNTVKTTAHKRGCLISAILHFMRQPLLNNTGILTCYTLSFHYLL
jgi:hypothetical protein